MLISSKLFLSDIAFNVSTKFSHSLVCNSVMSFEPVPINVSFPREYVCVNVLKSVPCNLYVSSLAKPMFISLNTIHSLNGCNAVKYVSSAHHICRAFPVTHNNISKQRQAFYPKTNVLFF